MIVVVSGVMRSGTSMVARICHQMGICMGTTFVAPPPGTALDLEYEDFAITAMAYGMLMEGSFKSKEEQFRMYIETRKAYYPNWGFKTPFILPFLSEAVAVLKEYDEVRTYLTHRPAQATLNSIQDCAKVMGQNEEMLANTLAIQTRLIKARGEADLNEVRVFSFEELNKDPWAVADEISGQTKQPMSVFTTHGLQDRLTSRKRP